LSVEIILAVAFVFAALLFYAWLHALWFWEKPDKGALDVEVARDFMLEETITTDINYIEGKKNDNNP
jgi:hypothetical protein